MAAARYTPGLGTGYADWGDDMKKVLVIVLLVMAVAGVVQAQDGGTELPAAPGEMVDVGGYSLHLNCIGEGGPTVVMDAGHGDFSMSLASLQEQVAEFTRVCTFDRAGYGWSDAGPDPRDSQQNVTELKALLENAGEEAPYILVGHSLGGINVILFAAENPDLTAGVVLLDSSHPDQMERFNAEVPAIVAVEDAGVAAYQTLLDLAEQGALTADMVADFQPPTLSEADVATWAQLFMQPKNLQAMINEYAQLDADLAEVMENGDLGDIPLIVIAHGLQLKDLLPAEALDALGLTTDMLDTYEAIWRELQEDHLNRSTNSRLIVAENSPHYVYATEPDLVVEAIQSLVDGAQP